VGAIVDAILCVVRTHPSGSWQRCVSSCASVEGRHPEPSAGLIDSQSMQGADRVGRESLGYDAGKKINGPLAVHHRRHPYPSVVDRGRGVRREHAGP
jgi:hypothetical protein